MRPVITAILTPDCDRQMKSCARCEFFDATKRTQSCTAHEKYTHEECVAALVAALEELTGKKFVEEKVGKWIREEHYEDATYQFACSLCHNVNGKRTPAYCPNCGARMT